MAATEATFLWPGLDGASRLPGMPRSRLGGHSRPSSSAGHLQLLGIVNGCYAAVPPALARSRSWAAAYQRYPQATGRRTGVGLPNNMGPVVVSVVSWVDVV
jgi:hypothetical protein